MMVIRLNVFIKHHFTAVDSFRKEVAGCCTFGTIKTYPTEVILT